MSAIKPIVGQLRRSLILDLSLGLGFGMVAGYSFWYGYHVPTVRKRDAYYAKLEEQRASSQGQ